MQPALQIYFAILGEHTIQCLVMHSFMLHYKVMCHNQFQHVVGGQNKTAPLLNINITL